MMGTMSMHYVTNPDDVVAGIQSLLDAPEEKKGTLSPHQNTPIAQTPEKIQQIGTKEHAYDTRSKVRDVLQ